VDGLPEVKLIVDNQIAALLAQNPSKILPHIADPENLEFKWPSLFEYLGCGAIFLDLPVFDKTHPHFAATMATLWATEEREVIFHVYDHLFTENLNQIRALPQINASFLLQTIKETRRKAPKVLLPALQAQERALFEHTAHTMHDLTLYLAWDRICVWISGLFNYPSTDSKFIYGLSVLKECLIESYQHITQQGRTSPSLYRMIETLFFYQMREENLEKHTAEEWTLLSQIFPVIKGENQLTDCFYIDDRPIFEPHLVYLTLDSPKAVAQRVALAQYMVGKIQEDFPQWEYVVRPQKIIHLHYPT
jgi:hypothetical protein